MNVNYTYVRPLKAETLKQMHCEELLRRENLSYEVYNNACILPSQKDAKVAFGLGGVVTEQREYVENSGIDGRFGGYYECDISEYRDEKVVYCGYLINHWGHFLVESIPRLWYSFENDSEIDKYVFVTGFDSNISVRGNYKEFFELLGIDKKLEIINRPIKYKEVVVPELSYKRTEYYSDEYDHIFEKIRTNALARVFDSPLFQKVFLSRRWFANHTEVGVDMLDDFFERNNFYVVYPEKKSLTEMIHYLHNADVCAAESGTLPHNFLFAEKGKEVVIIERQDSPNEIQVDIDKIKSLSVTYVDGYYTIYPVGAGFGPYYLVYNDYMSKFASKYGLHAPSKKYLTEKYLRHSLAQYMRMYRTNYGWKWAVEKWQLAYSSLFYESYMDTYTDVGDYLSGNKVFTTSQYFTIRYWKNSVKKILNLVRKII